MAALPQPQPAASLRAPEVEAGPAAGSAAAPVTMPAPARMTGHPLSGRNILQLIPALDAGGAEQSTLDVAQALAAVGARSLVASEGGRLVETLRQEGSLWLPFPAATKNPLVMARNVLRLIDLCRKQRVDLIHVRSRAPAWTAINVARRLNLPFVTTYHGAYSARLPVKVTYNSIMVRGRHRHRQLAVHRPGDHAPVAGCAERIRIVYSGTNMAGV